MEYLEQQWNEPNRSDHYLMQIAAIQARQRDLNKLKISFKFERVKQTAKKLTKELAIQVSKARWFARLGIKKDGK